MATEEQKNNQQTLNDLLKDYISGQLEAAEYTALVTSRTADLTDAIRKTVRQKREATELDRQLVSSVKKIADLARSLEKPYQSVFDVQKDIIKNDKEIIRLENSLGALRSKLSEAEIKDIETYKTAQQSVIDNEKLLGQLKSQLNAEEKKAANEYFDIINANQEAINKENKLKEQVDLSGYEAKKELIEKLKAAELKANEEVFISKQIVNQAEEAARKAQLNFQAALAGTNEEAKRLAKENLDIANSELDIAKQLNREYETLQFNNRVELSTAEKTLTNKEKELLAAQKLTEITAEELKDYERILKTRQDINVEAVEAVSTAEKNLALSRDELETSQKQLTTDAQIAAQAEESLEVARTNAKFLADQEAKQKELLKIQGLYNISLGFAEGFLKKMGANSAVIALGLEEGKKAAEEMALAIKEGEVSFRGPFKGLQKQLAVFSAGVKGTFKGMGEGLKQALGLAGLATLIGKALGNVASTIKKVILFPIKAAFSALLAPAKTIVSEIGGYFNEAFSYIRDNFFSIRGLVSTFKEGETLMKTLSLATEKVATDLGVSTASARQLNNQVARLSGEMGALPEKLAENMVALNQSFGTTQRFSNETVRSFNKLVERLGFSTEEAAELVKISKLQGETTNQTLQSYEDEVLALKNQYGIAISSKEIFQEISKVSSATRLTLIGQNKSIGTAVFQAKRLGLELSKIENISSSLLDFESSISKELEAELLIGRDLNLERARQAALQGDFAAVAKEISKEAGSAAEFGKLNIIQQESLAAAVGMTRDELAKVVETQALLEATGFEDMNSAQAEFNKLVASGMKIEEAQAKFRQKYGNEALDTQLAQVAYAKQRELQERKLAETQMAMAQAMLPVAQAFIKLQLTLQKIRNIIVQEMRPFFNAFSGLIGGAGKSMETGLYKYASLLGEKLNAVGLTLVQFFKTYGPNIKEIFMGVLDVFGSIYGFVGKIITQLFSIKTTGGGTKGIFDSISSALASAVDYINNIDVNALITKVKTFANDVKDTFSFIWEKVKQFVSFLKENKNITAAGAGLLAFNKAAPGVIGGVAGKAASGVASAVGNVAGKAGNVITQKLGLGEVFGDIGSTPSKPLYVSVVEGMGGVAEDLGNSVTRALNANRKAGIGGGFRSGARGLMSYAKDAFKGGRAGTVGRARLARAARGLVTGQGASFVGGTRAASTVAQAGRAATTAGQVASTTAQAGRAVTTAAGIGRAALGGGVAIVGIAAEMALDHFASKARESANSIDEQIAASNNEADIKKLNTEKENKLNAARNLEIGASTAKWAGIGASVGMLFGPFGMGIGAGVGAVAGFTAGMIEANKQRAFELTEEGKFQRDFRQLQLKNAKIQSQIELSYARLEIQEKKAIIQQEKKIREDFATQLKGIDLSVPMEKPTEAFKALAQTLFDTGKITEEQFKGAINGTISPLKLMQLASNNAANSIATLYKVAAAAAKEAGIKAAEQVATALGTSPELIQSQIDQVTNFTTNILPTVSEDLFRKYGKVLTENLDTSAVGVLRGQDSTVEGKRLVQVIFEQLKGIGIEGGEAKTAMDAVLAQLNKGGDFDISNTEDLQKLFNLITERVSQGYEYTQGLIIKAKGLAESSALEFSSTFIPRLEGIQTKLGSDNKGTTQLLSTQLSVIPGMESFMAEMAKGGIQAGEFDQIKQALVDVGSAAAAVVKSATTPQDQSTEAYHNAKAQYDAIMKAINALSPQTQNTQDGVIPSIQRVQDGSSISNNGPFTIQDSKGNLAITHPKDKLVVSPNVSYINDGATGKGGPVFPISEKFGALDVKVSPKGVMVQKVNDAVSTSKEFSLVQQVNDAFSVTETDNKFVEKIKEAKEQIWNTYNQTPRSVVSGNPGVYAWDNNVEAMFTLKPGMRSPQQLMMAIPTEFIHKLRTTEPELIGLRSDMGFADPKKVSTPVIQNLVNEAFSWTSGGYQYKKGNESTLDSILDPYQPELIRSLILGYAPVKPSSSTTFHTLDKKEGYKPGMINVGQSVSEGLSLEGAAVQQIQDAISPWEIFSNPIGAVKHYLLPVIVEESGHIIKSLFKSKTLLAPLKAILKKTPIIGHAMHAATGAINISHLLHKEGVTRDKLDQEVGKAALTTLGGIGGGILGAMLVGTLGTLATGPAGMVLSVLGGTVGGILGEMFAGFVADKLGARPVGSPIVSLFRQEHDELHPPTSASPNLAYTAPKPKTSPQRVSDGSSSSKGPFTIMDRLGNIAVTHPKDGIVVSPNISYVNDGATGKGGPVFPISEKFGALDVKVSPKGVSVQKVNDALLANDKTETIKEDIWNKYGKENRNVIPYHSGVYVWDDAGSQMFFIPEFAKQPSHINKALRVPFLHALRATSPELIGMRSDMGFVDPTKIHTPTVLNLVDEALGTSEGNPASGTNGKGNESTLNSILDPFQSELIRKIIKNYAPVSFDRNTTFHTLDKKEGYKPSDLISISQSVSEGLSLENVPQTQKVQDGSSISNKGGPVFPISEKFGALDVKVSPKGVMVQKVNDGVVAPSTYQEVLGSTSATNIISSNVISGLGVPGVTEENFKGQFTVATPSGLKNIVSPLNKMGKSKTLSEFIPSGPAIADNSFIVKYSDGKVDQILNEGNIKFPQDPYTKLNLTEISASGNGLLALSRALNEIKPQDIKLSTGQTGTIYTADRYGIGFKQDRKSSGLILDPGPINNLVATFNSLQELFPYLAVTKESDKYVTGIPATKINLGGKRNDYDSQIQYARTDYVPQLLNSTIKNFIPADRGIGEEALIKEGLEPFDFSKIKEVIENIRPKVPHLKDFWSNVRSEISYSEKAWEIVRDSFIPQYINRVLGFAQKYVSPQFYEQFKTVISPQTKNISFTFKDLFDNTELGRPGTTSGAAVKTAQGEYAEGSIQKTSDGISTVQHLQETNQIQQVNDGSALSSKGPFTITDKFGATAITAAGDGVVVSPNISYVNDGMVDMEPIAPVATSSTQQNTTVIGQDNSELKKELESMRQLMSELIKELPSIANRPIRVELDGNRIGGILGNNAYRG